MLRRSRVPALRCFGRRRRCRWCRNGPSDRRRRVDAPRFTSRVAALFKELRSASASSAGDARLRAAALVRCGLSDSDRGVPPAKPPARCSHQAAGWASSRSPGSTGATRRCWPAFRDPPPVLWMRGDISRARREPAVAIVGPGPRPLRPAGRRAARRRARRRGIVVASGLARGVDSAAHRGCLEVGGRHRCRPRMRAWIGVYPAEHAIWRQVSAEQGLWSASWGLARRRCRSTSRCGTVSSAGSPWPLSSSKPPKRAVR